MAVLPFAAGLGRAALRLRPPPPQAPWIAAPGVPVELAGDGVHFLPPPATVQALLARAGQHCASPTSPPRALAPGDRVVVLGGCRTRVERMPGAARLSLGLRLDPNRDDEADLSALPGVGPRLARRIVRDRARRGPFADLPALGRVSGLGPATMRALGPYLTLPKARPPAGLWGPVSSGRPGIHPPPERTP
jgi:competence protein ComEA